MDISAIFQFLKEYLSPRNFCVVIAVCIALGAGVFIERARGDRQEAELIKQYTTELSAYQDSIRAIKSQYDRECLEFRIFIWNTGRKIDSLNSIVDKCRKDEEDEDKD